MAENIKLQDIVDYLVVFGDRYFLSYTKNQCNKITFCQLYESVKKGIEVAEQYGISSNSVIGVVGENSLDTIYIDLILLGIGCTTVMFPEHEAAQEIFNFGSAKLDFLVVQKDFVDSVNASQFDKIHSFRSFALYRRKIPRSIIQADLNKVPAIIFSSGTSGRIKKILVNESGVRYNANLFFNTFGPLPDDQFLIFLPLSNFQQRLLIYGCILSGVNVCLSNYENVVGALRYTRPTLFLAPPIFYETAWKVCRIMSSNSLSQSVNLEQKVPAAVTEELKSYFGGRIRLMWSGMAPIASNILVDYEKAGMPLYEAYGMTEIGPITVNSPSRNRYGSVGQPIVKDSIKISEEGEIIVTSPQPLTMGYLDESVDVERSVYKDGNTINTGDIGYLDADGFLHIKGRKSDVIITTSGQKVHPSVVERIFYQLPYIKHAVLMGENEPYLGLLLIVEKPDPLMLKEIKVKVEELNESICRRFPIRKWCIKDLEFTSDNKMLTRNQKLHRGNIAEKFKSELFDKGRLTANL